MRGHRGLARLAGLVGALAIGLVGVVVSGTANAGPAPVVGPQEMATGGQGRLRDAINWVQWSDTEEEDVTTSKVVWATPTQVGSDHWFSTRCSVVPAGGPGEEYSAARPMRTYRTGRWPGDGLPYMYNQGVSPGGSTSSNTMVTGLENKDDGVKLSFDFSCSAYLIPSASDPSSTLNETTSVAPFTEVPLQGLIFADAESNNWVKYPISGGGYYEQEEYIKATPQSSIIGQTPTWRLLDSYRTSGCATNSVAELKGDTMRFRSDAAQCANMLPFYTHSGPSSVMFLQGSQRAHVTLKGGGKTGVALGSIALPDFGDAPESYGVASSLFQPQWTGGKLGADIAGTLYNPVDILDPDTTMENGQIFNLSQARDDFATNSSKLAGFSEPTPRLGVHEDSESQAHHSADADWDDTHADQVSGTVQNDEDGLADAPRDGTTHNIKINPDATGTFTQKVSCKSTADAEVKGWIDWNHDGAFDDTDEGSDQVACSLDPSNLSTGQSATLTWHVPDGAQPAVKNEGTQTQSFERVRITDQTVSMGGAIVRLTPTGVTTGGEVEDYAVDVHVSMLKLQVDLPGGRYDASDQFRMSAEDLTNTEVANATTAGSSTGVQANHIGPKYLAYGSDYTVFAPLAGGSVSGENRYSKSLSCVDLAHGGVAVSVDANGKFTMPADSNVQCTFTRLKRSNPTLQVTTHVNGGHATAGDFPTSTKPSVGGSSTSLPDGFPVSFTEGSWKITTDMSNKPGYEVMSALSCKIGSTPVSVTAGTVALTNGDNVVCEQTVTPRSATLTLKTEVERGDAQPSDFDFSVAAGSSPATTYTEGVAQTPSGSIGSVTGSSKDGYVQDGDIVYYKNTDVAHANPMTLAQAQIVLDNGESVTGIRKVTTHRPKLRVHLDRDYRYGGTAAGDGSRITLTPRGGLEQNVTLDQDEYMPDGSYAVAQFLNHGYKLTDIEVTAGGAPVTVNSDGSFVAPPDVDVVVTLKNVDMPGTLVWSRTDRFTGLLLRDSEWRLTGPHGEVVDVQDCTEATCTGMDQDPRPGQFRVTGLHWGGWTIAETRAPVGYGLTGPKALTLDPSDPASTPDGPRQSTFFESGDPVSHEPGLGGLGQVGLGLGGSGKGGSKARGRHGARYVGLVSTGAGVTIVVMITFVTMGLGFVTAVGTHMALRRRKEW
ncbi:CshA/CshB family fibrillar adhesin-related protein [Bifidobacterium sp. ESL0775]|uniref:CshA/CshB family fibrillar adhesin-related protein n=1 Tax=Bifidobacterium sp. ESL0775 TaxID=2983230 RepID=UPI0023F9DC5B|nr:CshA/CshB family fibrillar adhesin-related protein [Bifidobacterium sp. ESL0775]WEV69401.1 CshA/CshB family fibrillar adhesin-related protein [Bifidobacterium sp. ESL0775]